MPHESRELIFQNGRKRRRKKTGRRAQGGLVVIEDQAEAKLMLRRQRRQTARADAPWRQPVPPLIRHNVVIKSHPVRHLRQMSFGRGSGQFNTPRTLYAHESGNTSTRNLYDTGAGTKRRRRRTIGIPRLMLSSCARCIRPCVDNQLI